MTETDIIVTMNCDGVDLFILDPNPKDTENVLGTMDSNSLECPQYLKTSHMYNIKIHQVCHKPHILGSIIFITVR